MNHERVEVPFRGFCIFIQNKKLWISELEWATMCML